MEIRPHHLLCTGNFIGKGYSEDFVINMIRIKSALESGKSFILKNGSDEICKACPYNSNGICKDEDKVTRYDEKTKTVLNLEYGKEYKYNDVLKNVNDLICTPDKLGDICGDCEWAELCLKPRK